MRRDYKTICTLFASILIAHCATAVKTPMLGETELEIENACANVSNGVAGSSDYKLLHNEKFLALCQTGESTRMNAMLGGVHRDFADMWIAEYTEMLRYQRLFYKISKDQLKRLPAKLQQTHPVLPFSDFCAAYVRFGTKNNGLMSRLAYPLRADSSHESLHKPMAENASKRRTIFNYLCEKEPKISIATADDFYMDTLATFDAYLECIFAHSFAHSSHIFAQLMAIARSARTPAHHFNANDDELAASSALKVSISKGIMQRLQQRAQRFIQAYIDAHQRVVDEARRIQQTMQFDVLMQIGEEDPDSLEDLGRCVMQRISARLHEANGFLDAQNERFSSEYRRCFSSPCVIM